MSAQEAASRHPRLGAAPNGSQANLQENSTCSPSMGERRSLEAANRSPAKAENDENASERQCEIRAAERARGVQWRLFRHRRIQRVDQRADADRLAVHAGSL